MPNSFIFAGFFQPEGGYGNVKTCANCSKSYSLPVLKTELTSMKKLIVCILCLASTPLFAQIRLGIQGSFSSVNTWQTDGIGGLPTLANTWQLNAFQAGIFVEYDLGYSGFVLQPGLVYAQNGTHWANALGFQNTSSYQIGADTTTLRINSIRLPINILYKYEINSKWKVFVGVGPYIAKNLGGTEKGVYTSFDNNTGAESFVPINNTLKINSNQSYSISGNSNVTAFDFGMDILLGFSYKKFDVSASWNRGFTTIYHTAYVNLGNQFWNFTVGYTILGHKRKPKL